MDGRRLAALLSVFVCIAPLARPQPSPFLGPGLAPLSMQHTFGAQQVYATSPLCAIASNRTEILCWLTAGQSPNVVDSRFALPVPGGFRRPTAFTSLEIERDIVAVLDVGALYVVPMVGAAMMPSYLSPGSQFATAPTRFGVAFFSMPIISVRERARSRERRSGRAGKENLRLGAVLLLIQMLRSKR